MRKNWVGTVVLVGVSLIAGSLLSQMWVQVLGQNANFALEVPQVVVNQQAELPKWCVDFVSLSPQIRVITIVDTETKRIAVYHLNVVTGGVEWLSTRDIQPDLMVNRFNSLPPFPNQLIQEQQRLKETSR